MTDRLYFEAHEALEEIWFPIRKSKDEYSFLLKGFINAAVSLELLKRGKQQQSQKIYKVYKKYVTLDRINKIETEINFIALKGFIDNHSEKEFLRNTSVVG